MRGAKPKPTVLKLITGNPGRRPLNKGEPQPAIAIPEPPKLLEGEALREWHRLTPVMAELGLISELDRALVTAYCQLWARWFEAEEKLKQTGWLVKTPNDYPMQSPYLTIANRSLEQMRQLSEQIGLSPAARSRIRVEAPPGQLDFGEEFLRGRA